MAVTLEPCVAFPGKKSPPCAAAVILAGVERVVVGCVDPHPQVRGKGIHAMRRAGIQVEVVDPQGRIEDFYAGFGRFISTGRPRVTLKIAMSSDGMASAGVGERTAITGAEARAFVHSLRSLSDAVLVGGRTVDVDDPRLDVRDAPGPCPVPLVLAGRTGLPAERALWKNPRVIVLGSTRPAGLPGGVRFVELAGEERPSLPALLDWCGAQGAHDLLVEPGPTLLRAFLQDACWDRLWAIRSPRAFPRGVPFDPSRLLPATEPVKNVELGDDMATLWIREAGEGAEPPV
jgi:diaminohydroxyphosphoribosylaminopyrimidine deaminase / 5-amino-6-(5-phosphoribosylamino)uracil reductase